MKLTFQSSSTAVEEYGGCAEPHVIETDAHEVELTYQSIRIEGDPIASISMDDGMWYLGHRDESFSDVVIEP